MDLNFGITFDGRNGISFTQGEDRTIQLFFINNTDGTPINLTGAVVGMNFAQQAGGVVKRLSGAISLTAAAVVPAVGVTLADHGLVTGDPVTLAGAALPAPLVAATPYLVKVVDVNTFGFTDATGAPITLTTAGTGSFTMTNAADLIVTTPTAGNATLNLRGLVSAAIAAGLGQDFQATVLTGGKFRIVVEKNNLDVTPQPDP